jgi:predicted membrane protein
MMMALISYFGDARRTAGGSQLEDRHVLALLGEIRADYTQAPLAPGEHTLTVVATVGDVTIHLPSDVALAVEPLAMLGGVTVKDLASGADTPCCVPRRTPGYEAAQVRMRVRALALFGDVELIRVPPTGRLRQAG